MTGRGAWNVAGEGGTKKYKDETKPGPYYYLGTGKKPLLRKRNANEYAVYRAVVAYQDALNRALKTNLTLDGLFGPVTSSVVNRFQQENSWVGAPWGGIGPETSEALLAPIVKSVVYKQTKVKYNVVAGTIRTESLWDAGAVGFTDDEDLGLAQINGPSHPLLSDDQRLNPAVSAQFIVDYYTNALETFGGNVRDAVASYNLGAGGTRAWIAAGRPDVWKPTALSTPREVNKYIDKILAG